MLELNGVVNILGIVLRENERLRKEIDQLREQLKQNNKEEFQPAMPVSRHVIEGRNEN